MPRKSTKPAPPGLDVTAEEAAVAGDQSRHDPDISRKLARWAKWEATCPHRLSPDEMGVWERIWIAAGYLTDVTCPNSFARIRREPGKPPVAIFPSDLWARRRSRADEREVYLRQREVMFEQLVGELMKYGGRDVAEPLVEAWERLGKPRFTFADFRKGGK